MLAVGLQTDEPFNMFYCCHVLLRTRIHTHTYYAFVTLLQVYIREILVY